MLGKNQDRHQITFASLRSLSTSSATVDAGSSTSSEHATLSGFISEKKLNPQRFLLTHAHIDHVLGNRFIHDKYRLLPEVHENELYFLENMEATGGAQ